jgi:hypothetical protein
LRASQQSDAPILAAATALLDQATQDAAASADALEGYTDALNSAYFSAQASLAEVDFPQMSTALRNCTDTQAIVAAKANALQPGK